MKSYLKTSHSSFKEVVNADTGELIDQESITHSYMTKDKEEFFLIYASLIGLLGDLSSASVKTLSYILLNYKRESTFEIGGATRGIISQKMSISLSGVANALTELKEYDILFSPQKSVYMINPRYAYQGSTSDRKAAMKAIIELGCKDC